MAKYRIHLFFVLLLVIELFRNKGSVFVNAGYTILGVVYIGVFLGTFIGIRELFGNEFPSYFAQDYLNGEVRYTALKKSFPKEADELFKAAQDNAQWRYRSYQRMNRSDWNMIAPE